MQHRKKYLVCACVALALAVFFALALFESMALAQQQQQPAAKQVPPAAPDPEKSTKDAPIVFTPAESAEIQPGVNEINSLQAELANRQARLAAAQSSVNEAQAKITAVQNALYALSWRALARRGLSVDKFQVTDDWRGFYFRPQAAAAAPVQTPPPAPTKPN